MAYGGSLGEDTPLVDDHFVVLRRRDLTGITLGMNIDAQHRKALLEAITARPTPVNVFEAIEGDGFDVEIRPVS